VKETFLYHVFNSARFRSEVSDTSTGTKVKHTSPHRILSIKVYLPPVSEQEEISHFLDDQLDRIDTLTDETERVIRLLQKRRSVLISAAVTGQIDVRAAMPAVVIA
jgi:type I restriction enzyme S subunit